jgi:bifunctional DNase/RNase
LSEGVDAWRRGAPVIRLSVFSVLYSLLTRHRIVLLKRDDGEQFLPIWIGNHESDAIAMPLQGNSVFRPLTHDLLVNTIGDLGGEIQHVVVDDLRNNIFYAKIAIRQNGALRLVDSRPSDAIAVAARAKVPIYAEETVMKKAGIVVSPEIRSGIEGQDQLDVFRQFVDSLDLDDLGD